MPGVERVKDFVKKNTQIWLYLFFGALTTGVSVFSYALFARAVFEQNSPLFMQLSNVISWILSVTFAFVTNKIFVFRSSGSSAYESFKFFLARMGTLFLEIVMMHILVVAADLNDLFAKIFVQIVVIISNYIFSKFFVFGK